MKQNPFTVPDGYFQSVEEQVSERIHRPAGPVMGFIVKIKPALMLGLTFAIIAGLGYLVSELTFKISPQAEGDALMAMIDDGYLSSDFIYSYSEELDIDGFLCGTLERCVSLEEIDAYLTETLTEEEIMKYLLEE